MRELRSSNSEEILDIGREPADRRAITRQSLHDQTIDRLRDMIVEAELTPGDRIIENDLCEQLAISRTPLREALKVLASEGLVELLPHRGARVTEITAVEIGELFEVIATLEGLAAELAAANMKDRDIKRLESMHERMMKHHAGRRRHDYFLLNHKIHQLIVSLAGNSVLIITHTRLMAQARRGRYMAILSRERWDEAMQEHVEIMVAFRSHDAKAAGQIWRRHVQRTGDVVRATLDPNRRSKGRPLLYDDA